MGATLEQFASDCHNALKSQPGPAGREKVVELLQGVLGDPDFVAKNVDGSGGARKVLYEDPELGFAILAHAYEGAASSNPHDHGPSWAIYGQAAGETEMTEWEIVEPASENKAGKVKPITVYALTPGKACLYNEGQLHSPKRAGATRLIRIEGRNMDGVKRLAYEAI